MLDLNRRRLPVGIQSFKKIREGNFVYVDKSDLVLLMSIPGIALFYGGLVRQKNILSILMQTVFCIL